MAPASVATPSTGMSRVKGKGEAEGGGRPSHQGDSGPGREGLWLEAQVGWAGRLGQWHEWDPLPAPLPPAPVLWQVGGSRRQPSVSWDPWDSHPCPGSC